MERMFKRTHHLVPFSNEHRFGLECCWKIKQGIRADITPHRIARFVEYFWNSFLIKHLVEEERHLLGDKQDVMIAAALKEHVELKAIVDDITNPESTISLELLAEFVNVLDEHIQFEERF